MEQRVLGKTGIIANIMGFGGIPLMSDTKMANPRWGVISEEDAVRLIETALDKGYNFFDTARTYGDSEKRMGLTFKNRKKDFYIATKEPPGKPDEMLKAVETSLKLLNVDKIDLYQVHGYGINRDEVLQDVLKNSLKGLQQAKKKGLIDHIGISGHHAPTMFKAVQTGEFETLQFPYNLVNMTAEEELFPLARKMRMGIIVMKPFAGGALSGPSDKLQSLSRIEIKTTASLCLQYVMSNPLVSVVIPGINRFEHLEENWQTGEMAHGLDEAEKKALLAEAKKLGEGFCRQCGYCMPCPNNINIPEVFRYEGYFSRYGLEGWARAQYEKLETKPEVCTECGQCEEKCPYEIDIPNKLKDTAKVLEGE
jgi:predicted aldo/keto reductase-like oxidoreductase